MAHGIPARLSAAEGRKFAFTVGAAFLVFGTIALWREHARLGPVLLGLGAVLGVLGVVAPAQLGPLNRAWMGLAHLISKVTTPIFMGVVFFVVITPVAVIMRLMGRGPMGSRRGATSYWVVRDTAKTRGDLSRQF